MEDYPPFKCGHKEHIMAMSYGRQNSVIDFLDHTSFKQRLGNREKQATFMIDCEILERLREYKEQTGINQKVLVRHAIEEFLRNHSLHQYKDDSNVIDLIADSDGETYVLR